MAAADMGDAIVVVKAAGGGQDIGHRSKARGGHEDATKTKQGSDETHFKVARLALDFGLREIGGARCRFEGRWWRWRREAGSVRIRLPVKHPAKVCTPPPKMGI
jgi:hypothetical protein